MRSIGVGWGGMGWAEMCRAGRKGNGAEWEGGMRAGGGGVGMPYGLSYLRVGVGQGRIVLEGILSELTCARFGAGPVSKAARQPTSLASEPDENRRKRRLPDSS